MSAVVQRVTAFTAKIGKAAVPGGRHREDLERLAQSRGGVLLGTTRILSCLFDDPAAALDCAAAALTRHAAANRELPPERRASLRIAIHTGEFELEGASLRGAAAAILEQLLYAAPAGRVLASGDSCSAAGRARCAFVALGRELFQGAPEPLQIFEIAPLA